VLGIEDDWTNYNPSRITWPEVHNRFIVIKGLGTIKEELQTENDIDSAFTDLHIYDIQSMSYQRQ
jgi:hypothetical protein